MRELPQHVVARVSGPSWEPLRKHFAEIGRLLLEASPEAACELVARYVKFTTDSAPDSPAFAVVWIRTSQRLLVGLALPEAYEAEGLGPALPKSTYKGLTKYFTVERDAVVPKGLAAWARLAYETASRSFA